MDVMVLPFADLPCIYRRYKAGSQPNRAVGWTPVWFPANTATNRAVPGVVAVTDVVTGATEVSWDKGYVPKSSTDLDARYGRMRGTYFGVTGHLDAPQLSDQGRIVAGQVAIPYEVTTSPISGNAWISGTAAGGDAAIDSGVYMLDDVPLDEDCLTQAAIGAANWEAREGIYMPMRFRDPVHLFTQPGTKHFLGIGTNAVLGTRALESTVNVAAPAGFTGSLASHIAPSCLTNFQTGVILFRGIANNSNIQLKFRMGVEGQVDTCSSISPFQTQSPLLDQVAIDRVTELAQVMSNVYPARYNDFGAIIGSIISGAKIALPIGKQVGGLIRGLKIPVVSDLVGTGLDFISSIGLAPGRRRRRRRKPFPPGILYPNWERIGGGIFPPRGSR
jgi:hypothetical protein